MRVKVGLTGRERQSKEEKKKHLGQSFLAVCWQLLFYFYLFILFFQYVSLYPMLGCNISLQIAYVIKFKLFNKL